MYSFRNASERLIPENSLGSGEVFHKFFSVLFTYMKHKAAV
jgi:hypothetical protein